ncbi:MAG TPA: hypothetical protein DCZ48_13435, partial [Methylococcaceae bacterium]|nr:hypothetical protein [Methylococcaceae bacterium]
ERFEDRWNWDGLSRNEALPWSFELIERFESRLDWMSSAAVAVMYKDLPTLRPADIVTIMEYHFGTELIGE